MQLEKTGTEEKAELLLWQEKMVSILTNVVGIQELVKKNENRTDGFLYPELRDSLNGLLGSMTQNSTKLYNFFCDGDCWNVNDGEFIIKYGRKGISHLRKVYSRNNAEYRKQCNEIARNNINKIIQNDNSVAAESIETMESTLIIPRKMLPYFSLNTLGMSSWGEEKTENVLNGIVSILDMLKDNETRIDEFKDSDLKHNIRSTLLSMSYELTKLYAFFCYPYGEWDINDNKLIEEKGHEGIAHLKEVYNRKEPRGEGLGHSYYDKYRKNKTN